MTKKEEREIFMNAVIEKHKQKPYLTSEQIIDELFDDADIIGKILRASFFLLLITSPFWIYFERHPEVLKNIWP